MVEEVFEGFFRVIGRLITQVIIEFVFEILIKGPGYFITKQFTVEKPEIDSATVVFVGFLFWILVGLVSYFSYAAIYPTA